MPFFRTEPPSKVWLSSDSSHSLHSDGSGTAMVGPVVEGGTLRLTCYAKGGTPAPSITWWDGDRRLDTYTHVKNRKQKQNAKQKTKQKIRQNENSEDPFQNNIEYSVEYPTNQDDFSNLDGFPGYNIANPDGSDDATNFHLVDDSLYNVNGMIDFDGKGEEVSSGKELSLDYGYRLVKRKDDDRTEQSLQKDNNFDAINGNKASNIDYTNRLVKSSQYVQTLDEKQFNQNPKRNRLLHSKAKNIFSTKLSSSRGRKRFIRSSTKEEYLSLADHKRLQRCRKKTTREMITRSGSHNESSLANINHTDTLLPHQTNAGSALQRFPLSHQNSYSNRNTEEINYSLNNQDDFGNPLVMEMSSFERKQRLDVEHPDPLLNEETFILPSLESQKPTGAKKFVNLEDSFPHLLKQHSVADVNKRHSWQTSKINTASLSHSATEHVLDGRNRDQHILSFSLREHNVEHRKVGKRRNISENIRQNGSIVNSLFNKKTKYIKLPITEESLEHEPNSVNKYEKKTLPQFSGLFSEENNLQRNYITDQERKTKVQCLDCTAKENLVRVPLLPEDTSSMQKYSQESRMFHHREKLFESDEMHFVPFDKNVSRRQKVRRGADMRMADFDMENFRPGMRDKENIAHVAISPTRVTTTVKQQAGIHSNSLVVEALGREDLNRVFSCKVHNSNITDTVVKSAKLDMICEY